MSTYRGRTSMTHKIFLFIEDNPGSARRDIIAALDLNTTPHIVSNLISRLAKQGRIVNRGGVKAMARWYVVDRSDIPPRKYLELSEKLLAELSHVYLPWRADRLAQRLEEIFG